MKPRLKRPKIVYSGRKPVAVLLDLATYEELLERVEDKHDLEYVAKLRARPQDFKPLKEVFVDIASKRRRR